MTGEETFHPDTRALLAYGRVLAGSGDPPPRAPGQTVGADRLAERLFVFDRQGDGRLMIRTFGAELTALFGQDLRDRDFAALWPPADRGLLSAFISAVSEANQPGILRVRAEAAAGARLGAEILITPLRTPPLTADRYLGLFQPLGGEAFADGVARLRLGSLHPPEARLSPAPLRLVVSN
ncbi:MAG: PAS domain-containing protein [Hyphomonadaceae bacterium]|nr:PAS domain-containing protein [Hyphomonadaceae bacterium]